MRIWLMLILLACNLPGCAPRVASHVVTPDTPPDAVASAAARSLADYASALADAAESTAVAVEGGKLDSPAAVYDALAAANKSAREAAFQPYTAALDQAVPPDQPFNAAKIAKAFRSASAGFRGAIGGRK